MILCSFWVGTGARAQAPTGQYALAGQWRGALAVPGGTLPLTITITEPGNGNRLAVLDVPRQRVNREPMTATLRGDTLLLEAEQAGCRFVGRRSADGQQLLGTWQQPGHATPLTLLYVAPAAAAAKAAKFPPPYRVEEVKVPNTVDHLQLAGTLTTPTGEGPFPAVVLLSGQDTQTRDAVYGDFALFGSLADYLTRRGIAVLRLDDRGVGQSGGDSTAATTADRVHDAQAALAFLRSRPVLDVARLGLIGHGEGGNVALLAATQPLPPRFVVTMGAAGLPGRELLTQQRPSLLLRAGTADTAMLGLARRDDATRQEAARQAAKMRAAGSSAAQVGTYLEQQRMRQKAEDKKRLDAQRQRRVALLDIIANAPDNAQAQAIVANMIRQDAPGLDAATIQAAAARLTTPWFRHYANFNPQPELVKVSGNVLLLHGGADDIASAQANLEPLTKGLKSGNARITTHKFEGVNHLFQAPTTEWPLVNGQPRPVISPAALQTMLDWILKDVK